MAFTMGRRSSAPASPCSAAPLALALLLALAAPAPSASDTHHKQFKVGGLPVHTVVGLVGAHRPRSTATVLLLHGQRFQAKTWTDLGTLDLLPQHGVDAVAVDLPGYGLTPPSTRAKEDPKGWLLDFLQAASAVLKHPPILVSPSMSGRFAVPALVAAPARFAAWVAVAPVGVAELKNSIDALPAVGIYGSKDNMRRDLVHLADVFPPLNFRSTIVEGARHPCYLDNPALFHSTLLALARCVGPGGEKVLAACTWTT